MACACISRVWCCIWRSRVRISYLLCFDGLLMFLLFICVFWAANKTQERACAESNLYPFCCGVAEILICELMLEPWPRTLAWELIFQVD